MIPDLKLVPGALPGDELVDALTPLAERLRAHPFWTGLRDGSVPAHQLRWFAYQDLRLIVPAYARALARCAASAPRNRHAALLAGAAGATFSSLPVLGQALDRLGSPGPLPEAGAMRAYASFLVAAPVHSFAAGLGGLLPMSWFHFLVSEVLADRAAQTSYAPWIDSFRAFDGYLDYLHRFLSMVYEARSDFTTRAWLDLVSHARDSGEYEISLADAAWARNHLPETG